MGLPINDAYSTNKPSSLLRHSDKFVELRRKQLAEEINAQLEIIDTLLLAHVLHGGALNDPIKLSLDKDLAYFIGLTLNHKGYFVRYSNLDTKTVLSIHIRA